MLPSELTFKNRHRTLERQVNDVEFMKQKPLEYKKTVQEFRYLTAILAGYAAVKNLEKQLKEALSLRQEEKEAELLALVEEEVTELEGQLKQARLELQTLLLPKDANLGRDVIIEIRAGTGGEEACLFVADLLRMYERLAEKKKWQLAPLSASRSKLKGFKEIIFSLKGKTAYENMKFETGIHRVQRIPQTEASGRVHTSAISVAVLPEVEESEVKVNPEALKIDTYRASGAGGQHVNTTDSAIRITHLPTGLVVTCQDERSQIKNREKALRILRAKLHEKKTSEEKKKRDEARKEQVGSGDRSEKIRTYNFPQGRVTDHRSGLTLYQLEDFLNGEVEEMLDSLKQAEVKEKMQAH